MTQEKQTEISQYIKDSIELEKQEIRRALWDLHAESSLGGDGAWNDYGDDSNDGNC